jgi:MFS family permease
MLLTAGLALVSRLNPPEDRGRAVGQFFGLVAAVPALGPFLSGALIGWFSWRWLFVIPLVLPAVALVITRQRVPETSRATERRPNVSGALLIFLTLGAFSVALIVGAADLVAPLPLIGAAVAVVAGSVFVLGQRHAVDPLLPRRLLGRRPFLGGNLIWLVACITSWGAVFFVAVMLQTTLGLAPMAAGLLLTPIYLVMMIGSPLVGKLADRIGPRLPILGGLSVYACGLFLLSRIGPTSSVVPDVVLGILVMAVGMATFTAPLAAATMGALDEADQGVASAFNNTMGQLAGLLAIVLLPAAAGLGGVAFSDPAFALGYGRALLAVTVLAAVCIPLAAWTFPTRRRRTRTDRSTERLHGPPSATDAE